MTSLTKLVAYWGYFTEIGKVGEEEEVRGHPRVSFGNA